MEPTESKIIKPAVPSEPVERLLSAGIDEVLAALQSDNPRTQAMALLIMELLAPHDERTVLARRAKAPSLRYRIRP